MSKIKLFLVVALYGLLQAAFIGIASADVIWLSETPPSKRAAAVSGVVVAHQHSGGAEVDAGGEVVEDMSFDTGLRSVIFPGRRHS